VSVNRIVRKMFGLETDEVTGEWRRLRNKELYDLCSSPLIIRVKMSRKFGYTEHVARIVDRRMFW